jgi:ABC-type phosphate transport system substrate-binding protein
MEGPEAGPVDRRRPSPHAPIPRGDTMEEHRVTLTHQKRLLALGLAAAVVLAACSGGGGSAGPSDAGGGNGSSAPGAAVPDCLSFADIYALVGPESTGFATWGDAQAIATELGSTTTFPDVPLTITAPGEESGTFDSFVELTIEDIAEERGQDGTTRPDYTSSSNDNAIIDGVSGSAGSFGWVGFAFFEENVDTVRAFDIAAEAGGACVTPTAESIASNEYPLARDLFIYVNAAKAAENPALTAYVDFYLADGTIASVLENVPYVNLAPEALAETQAAWDAANPGNADPAGSIFVSGSSTVEPVSNGVAEAFKAENPGFDYVVEGPGTGDGFAKFCAGETDISDASRAISDEEVADCQAAGIEYVELKVAIDGIAVLTAP